MSTGRGAIAQNLRSEWMVWLAFVALHAVLFYLDLFPRARIPFGDEVMYRSLAESAALGTPGTLEPLWPPLYVWALAPLARFGDGWFHLASLLQVMLLAASALVFRSLLDAITGSPPAARLGQALMLLDPHFAAFAHYAWPEVPHVAMVVLLFWLLVVRPAGSLWWVASGVVIGVIGLTKSVLQPFLPLIVLPLAHDLGWRPALMRAAGIGAIAAGLMLPVALANLRTHGVLVVADAARFNLWVGLNSDGRRSARDDIAAAEFATFESSAPTFVERQSILSSKVSAYVREHGLAAIARRQLTKQYFRLFDYRNFLTEQLTGGVFNQRNVGYARPGRAISFLLQAWNAVFYACVLAAAGIGLWTSASTARPWVLLIAGLFVYGLVIFFALEARSRFRIPLMLPLWTAAAVALADRTCSIRGTRLVAGVITSAALLAFAFGADYLP